MLSRQTKNAHPEQWQSTPSAPNSPPTWGLPPVANKSANTVSLTLMSVSTAYALQLLCAYMDDTS